MMREQTIQKSNPEDINDAFASATAQNEMAEVLKELFDKDKIFMIGDLSKDEIKLATRIYMIAELKNIRIWKDGLAFFCQLMLSKNRKSRKELIDAIKGYTTQKSIFNRLNPFSK